MMLTAYLFYSFFGYLSGSVLYSYLIPKYFCHVDVRTVNEDQNPGAFNAFSVAGLRIGLLCVCLLYTSPRPRDRQKSRMPSSA